VIFVGWRPPAPQGSCRVVGAMAEVAPPGYFNTLPAVEEADDSSPPGAASSTQQLEFDAAGSGTLIVDDQFADEEAAQRASEEQKQQNLGKSVSDTALVVAGDSRRSSARSSTSTWKRRQARGSPFQVPPPFLPPQVDQFGFPNSRVERHEGFWDERHHLKGSENELKPKLLRQYFSRPQNRAELVDDLATNPTLYNTRSILRTLDQPDASDRKRTPLVPDTGAPLLPTRHTFGGHMKDLDGKTRKWNDRWQNSLSALNDNYHPDHRAYFTQYSLFEESPSQRWRRFLDQEVEHGVWEPIKTKKRSRFPPLGARMRGRSGTPIPGATF